MRFLPKRLLDVGPLHLHSPRLITTSDLPHNEECKYTTLSHRWGNVSRTTRTEQSNIHQHLEKGINWEALSKTFQDAILITQLLEYRYLWIDSLCIVQDLEQDFEEECAQMHMIYLHCDCMIAASDAENCDEGFLGYWDDHDDIKTSELCMIPALDPSLARELRVNKTIKWDPWSNALNGVLTTRGWTLQERQLSPRILHYTRRGLLFECRCTIGAGDGQALHPRRLARGCYRNENQIADLLRVLDSKTPISSKGSPMQWLRIVEDYSKRTLTYEEDKLPAISGLARILVEVLGGDMYNDTSYLVGNWTGGLAYQLLWYPRQPLPGEATTDSLPSWSWASTKSPISFNFASLLQIDFGLILTGSQKGTHKDPYRDSFSTTILPEFKYIGTNIMPHGSNPFGRISGGWIEICGLCLDRTPTQPLKRGSGVSRGLWEDKFHLDGSNYHSLIAFDVYHDQTNSEAAVKQVKVQEREQTGPQRDSFRYLFLIDCFTLGNPNVWVGLVLKVCTMEE